MNSDELIKRVKNYGRLSYNNGYNEGYVTGFISGILLCSICLFAGTALRK